MSQKEPLFETFSAFRIKTKSGTATLKDAIDFIRTCDRGKTNEEKAKCERVKRFVAINFNTA